MYDGELEKDDDEDDDEEEYGYIYREPRQRRREVVLRTSRPAKQRLVYQYQQVHPRYVYVYDGEEEHEDGELYYAPPHPGPRSPDVPRSAFPTLTPMSPSRSRRPPRSVPVPLARLLAPPSPVRRPRSASCSFPSPPSPARRVRTAASRIYEVDDDRYTIAGDDAYDDVPLIARPVPKGRVHIGK